VWPASATAALSIERSFVLFGYLIEAMMLCSSGRGERFTRHVDDSPFRVQPNR
jgi:hypothetical protein